MPRPGIDSAWQHGEILLLGPDTRRFRFELQIELASDQKRSHTFAGLKRRKRSSGLDAFRLFCAAPAVQHVDVLSGQEAPLRAPRGGAAPLRGVGRRSRALRNPDGAGGLGAVVRARARGPARGVAARLRRRGGQRRRALAPARGPRGGARLGARERARDAARRLREPQRHVPRAARQPPLHARDREHLARAAARADAAGAGGAHRRARGRGAAGRRLHQGARRHAVRLGGGAAGGAVDPHAGVLAARLPRRLPHRLPRAHAVRRLARRRAQARAERRFERRRRAGGVPPHDGRALRGVLALPDRDRRRARLLLRRRRRLAPARASARRLGRAGRAQAPPILREARVGRAAAALRRRRHPHARQDLGDVHPQRRARRRDPRPHRHPRHHEDRSVAAESDRGAALPRRRLQARRHDQRPRPRAGVRARPLAVVPAVVRRAAPRPAEERRVHAVEDGLQPRLARPGAPPFPLSHPLCNARPDAPPPSSLLSCRRRRLLPRSSARSSR